MDTREHGVGGLAAAEPDPPVMTIADVGESAVALQAVRDHDGARADGLLDERQQAGRRGVRDPAQANPTDGRAAHLRSDSNQGLLADVATPPTGPDAAHERFVHFHRAGQAVPAGAHHGAAELSGTRRSSRCQPDGPQRCREIVVTGLVPLTRTSTPGTNSCAATPVKPPCSR